MEERILAPRLQTVPTPDWRELCRELGIRQTGRRGEIQSRVVTHLLSDEGMCRNIKGGGSALLRAVLGSLRLPMPGLRPAQQATDPGFSCICSGQGYGPFVACSRCRTSQHRACVGLAFSMRDYECPLCQLRQMDPLEQVIDVVVPATLCQVVGEETEPRSFIYSIDTHAKLMDPGRRKNLQLRCIRLDKEGYVHRWPMDCTIFVNSRPIYTLSAPPIYSSRKRKDYPTCIKDFIPGSTNTVMILKQKEDDAYCFGLFLVEQMAAEEVYNAFLYQRVLTVEAGQAFVQSRCSGSEEVTADVYRQPLKCPLTRLMPEVPARGVNCQHVQCFDLRAYIVLQEKTKTNKWRCPICFSLVLHITVDRYMQCILSEAQRVAGCEAVEFQPSGDYKLIVEERSEADEEIGEVRPKRVAEVVIEDEPVKRVKTGKRLLWEDFTANGLDSFALYSCCVYQSAYFGRTKDGESAQEDDGTTERSGNNGKSASAAIEID